MYMIAPEIYQTHVQFEMVNKVLYVQALDDIYETLK